MSSNLQIVEKRMTGCSDRMSRRRWKSIACMTVNLGFRNATTFMYVEAGRYLFGWGLMVDGAFTVIS